MVAIFLLLHGGCQSNDQADPPSTQREVPESTSQSSESSVQKIRKQDHRSSQAVDKPSITGPHFEDQASQLGIDFVYDTGAFGQRLMTEATGGGVGWLDYDLDGNLDLYFAQGGNPQQEIPHPDGDQLYRQIEGRNFQRITQHLNLKDESHSQCISVGDYDNDGFPDLFISNVGQNQLLHNLGDGTFEDVTLSSGIGEIQLWSTTAVWADLDLDGDLDLYICNYTNYNPKDPLICRHPDGSMASCDPLVLDAVANECYENLGDGNFRLIANKWGLVAADGKSLGVVSADFNRDGMLDLYVANDVTPNHLFQAEGAGRFREQAVVLGVAASELGQYQASMGIGCGDYDRNGFLDLYLTHFTDDSNTLYQNLGEVGFRDVTRITKLHQPTLPYLAFGTVMSDFDFDGRMDMFIANGHIDDLRDRGHIWKMSPQLFTYNKNNWEETTKQSGGYFEQKRLGRAVAQADYDQDGLPDLLVVNQHDSSALLKNTQRHGHGLAIRLYGTTCNRQGWGAEVEVLAGEERYVEQLVAGESFGCSHDPTLFFGLGDWTGDCEVTIRWPQQNRLSETISVPVDHRIEVFQGAPSIVRAEAFQ